MSADIIVIFIFCLLGLAAQGARNHAWLEWTLRVIYCFAFIAELTTALSGGLSSSPFEAPAAYTTVIMWVMAVVTGLLLFKPFRLGLSYVLTPINQIVGGGVLLAIIQKTNIPASFLADRVFVAESIPHMNALWIYITVIGSLLGSINPNAPMPLPFPVPMDSLFSYNFLGLVLLSMCGAGILVARKFPDVMKRLGLVKPAGWHIGVGLLMIPVTFLYDYLWSFYTGTPQAGIGSKLATYNAGTFQAGGAAPAMVLALATGICAGIGEETLIRGGLQPVFGIVPAGVLHGVLHAQFNHAPILMLQVAGWSCMMGIVRRYTNTTTTIITHASYNFLTTFLFAFNP